MPIRSRNNSSVWPETTFANVFSLDEAAYAVGATKRTLARRIDKVLEFRVHLDRACV